MRTACSSFFIFVFSFFVFITIVALNACNFGLHLKQLLPILPQRGQTGIQICNLLFPILDQVEHLFRLDVIADAEAIQRGGRLPESIKLRLMRGKKLLLCQVWRGFVLLLNRQERPIRLQTAGGHIVLLVFFLDAVDLHASFRSVLLHGIHLRVEILCGMQMILGHL
jgi:hypothetical protein